MKKRLLAWMLAMLMLLAVTPVTVLAAQPKQYEVSTLEELLTAVREINRDGGENVITLKSNIVLDASKWTESDSALSFQNGTTTLLGEGHTLTMDRVGHRGMDVYGSAKLFLGSEGYEQLLALVGSGSSDEEDGVLLNPILNLSGQSEVRIYDGVSIRDTFSRSTSAAIQLQGGSVLRMYGGEITNCANTYSTTGGVHVWGSSSFYMYGGSITNCTSCEAGAVTVYPGGSAYLIAGEISGNHNIGYGQGYGGGVYVHTGTAEIGSGMKICNNTADDGGDDIFSYYGTITVEQVASGMTLNSTGKAITGWYEDGLKDVRWHCEEEDPTKNHLEKMEPVTAYTEPILWKAAHGLSEADSNQDPVKPAEQPGSLLDKIKGRIFFVPEDFPFYDVDSNHWFYEPVKSAWEQELIDGVTARYYMPDNTLTVAQAIKLAAALHQKQSVGFVTLQNGGTHWYDNYVNYAIANGLIEAAYQSKSAEMMNAPVSRAEFVHILAKLLNAGTINTVNSIPDVKSGDAYADEIFAFYRAGILTGSDRLGTFHPTSSLKRSEAAAILVRLYDASQRQYITLK